MRMKYPKIGLSFLPLIIFDNSVPITIPIMEIAEIVPKKFQSISTLFIEEKNPIRELNETMTNEVPMATFIGVFNKLTKAGIIKNPPPAPSKPVMIPTAEPCPAARTVLFLDAIFFTFESQFF